jgi:predicted DNA-binding transcriptional regulator AlpA
MPRTLNGLAKPTDALPPAAEPVPLLLPQPAAWRYAGLSRSGWFRLRSQGALPAPVRVKGAGLLWRRADLEQWAARLRPVRAG